MQVLVPFLAMAGLGLVGVASLAPTLGPMLPTLRAVPGLAGRSDAELVMLALVQPAILAVAGALVGALLAERVGLRSLIMEALRGGSAKAAPATFLTALALGFATGAAILALDRTLFVLTGGATALDGGGAPTLAARASALLYGGVTEEIVMRFGLMTLLAWAGAALLPGLAAQNPGALMLPAIALTALLFGLGHLPKLYALTEPGLALVLRTVALNVIAGLVYGWLYWRLGLEHAMLAHMATHLAFWTLGPILARAAGAPG
ncbi:MAG TPA: CPBP family glutamic-type intramembrane protease [Microvirga sp.]|nr:CPBP family glutamic-type intramembrane protease [Microvirga sp.]